MEEVLTRRLTALLAERDRIFEAGQQVPKFAYPPQLLLVDGGKGQLGVAMRVLEELGLEDEIPVAALAKQFEEVCVPGQADADPHPPPVRRAVPAAAHPRRGAPLRHHLPPAAAGQAHDEVGARRHPRLGPARRKRLIAELGGVNAVKAATARAAASR